MRPILILLLLVVGVVLVYGIYDSGYDSGYLDGYDDTIEYGTAMASSLRNSNNRDSISAEFKLLVISRDVGYTNNEDSLRAIIGDTL